MLNEVWKEIVKYDKILIHRHVSPDPDAYGSQLGLKALIKHHYPNKIVKAVGYNEPTLSWMGEMDEVIDEEYQGALVIITDTANAKRIDDGRFDLGTYLIKLDHHPAIEDYGNLNVVNTQACATSELIIELYEANKEAFGLTLTKEIGELLYAGIIADSGRFLYDNTTKDTLNRVAMLYDLDINRDRIHHEMYKRQLNIIQAQGYVLSNFEVSRCGVAYVKMTKEQQQQFELTTATRSALVNVLANIEGIYVWVCFFENDENIRVNIRSSGPIINTVAEKFDGGGHPKASGALIYDWTSCGDVIAALDEACVDYLNQKAQ